MSAESGSAIDALGWVQFERLCDEVVRLGGLEPDWDGRADTGRFATVADVVLAVIWVRPFVRRQLAPARLVEQIAATLAKEARGRPVRLFTNLVLDQQQVQDVEASAGYVGPRELSLLIDREPGLRRRVPSVLGVRDLDALLPAEVVARSTGDVAAARELAPVFVPTRAYERAIGALQRHGFAVLAGPPEMGKTAIARTVALALLTEGWEFHECVRPDELWQRFARDRPQLFIADDAFGSTEYHPDAAQRWALELDRVLRALDDRHWLIWTSRPTPLKAALSRVHREHGVERWPQPAEIQVAADRMDVEEKALILFRHARATPSRHASISVVPRNGWSIVSHPHFTPERIRRFVARLAEIAYVSKGRLAAAVEREIREPTAGMAASLRALPDEHRGLLTAMLDVAPGPVPERDLAAAARRHLRNGMPKPPGELVDRLSDHFLRLVPPATVTWVHPSWRDLVIDDLAADADARRRFLAHCSLEGILLALSTAGGATGERALPLLRDDRDWDTIADRLHELLRDLASDDLARLLRALATALHGTTDRQIQPELEALAAETLETSRRHWDTGAITVAPTVLEGWLELRGLLKEWPPSPDLIPTWRRLVPRRVPHADDAAALHEFDDWLRLAGALRTHLPNVARDLGFPHDYAELFDDLVHRAVLALDSDPSPPTAGLLADILRRIDDLTGIAPSAGAVAHRLTIELERARPEARAPTTAVRGTAAADVVNRILRDL